MTELHRETNSDIFQSNDSGDSDDVIFDGKSEIDGPLPTKESGLSNLRILQQRRLMKRRLNPIIPKNDEVMEEILVNKDDGNKENISKAEGPEVDQEVDMLRSRLPQKYLRKQRINHVSDTIAAKIMKNPTSSSLDSYTSTKSTNISVLKHKLGSKHPVSGYEIHDETRLNRKENDDYDEESNLEVIKKESSLFPKLGKLKNAKRKKPLFLKLQEQYDEREHQFEQKKMEEARDDIKKRKGRVSIKQLINDHQAFYAEHAHDRDVRMKKEAEDRKKDWLRIQSELREKRQNPVRVLKPSAASPDQRKFLEGRRKGSDASSASEGQGQQQEQQHINQRQNNRLLSNMKQKHAHPSSNHYHGRDDHDADHEDDEDGDRVQYESKSEPDEEYRRRGGGERGLSHQVKDTKDVKDGQKKVVSPRERARLFARHRKLKKIQEPEQSPELKFEYKIEIPQIKPKVKRVTDVEQVLARKEGQGEKVNAKTKKTDSTATSSTTSASDSTSTSSDPSKNTAVTIAAVNGEESGSSSYSSDWVSNILEVDSDEDKLAELYETGFSLMMMERSSLQALV